MYRTELNKVIKIELDIRYEEKLREQLLDKGRKHIQVVTITWKGHAFGWLS